MIRPCPTGRSPTSAIFTRLPLPTLMRPPLIVDGMDAPTGAARGPTSGIRPAAGPVKNPAAWDVRTTTPRTASPGRNHASRVDHTARVRGASVLRHARHASGRREPHGGAGGRRLVPAALGGHRESRAARDPPAQPRGGAGARRDGA